MRRPASSNGAGDASRGSDPAHGAGRRDLCVNRAIVLRLDQIRQLAAPVGEPQPGAMARAACSRRPPDDPLGSGNQVHPGPAHQPCARAPSCGLRLEQKSLRPRAARKVQRPDSVRPRRVIRLMTGAARFALTSFRRRRPGAGSPLNRPGPVGVGLDAREERPSGLERFVLVPKSSRHQSRSPDRASEPRESGED